VIAVVFWEFEKRRGLGGDARVFAFRLALTMLLDPRPVHADTTLGADACAQVVVLVPHAAYHAGAPRVPRPERQTVKERDCAVEIDLGGKVDKSTRRPRDQKDGRRAAPWLAGSLCGRGDRRVEETPQFLVRNVTRTGRGS
jgi:hypothetical protein